MEHPNRTELIDSLEKEVRKFIAAALLFNLEVAERLGSNATDLQCLNFLTLQGEATPGQLAKWTRLSTGGVTVALDRLEKSGYIRREPNPNDRRSVLVRPVMAKLKTLHSIYQVHHDVLATVAEGYTQAELRVIIDFFSKTSGGSVSGGE